MATVLHPANGSRHGRTNGGGDELLERIALAVEEHRLELQLSRRELAAWSGVSASTIGRLERGGRVHKGLARQVASTLVTLEVYRPTPAAASPVLTVVSDDQPGAAA